MKRFDQINMIPFIDIMLVLLAIVLTTATFVSQGLIEVNLPEASQVAETQGDQEALEIAINAKNELFFKEEPLAFDALDAKLEGIAGDTPIVLRVDKAAVFDSFVKLIGVLKARQLDNLSIQAQESS